MSFTHVLAGRVVDWLVRGGAVNAADRELYAYGADKLISSLICLAMTLLPGVLLRVPAGSALFFLSYTALRVHAGGYHADTPLRCFLVSVPVSAVPVALVWGSAYWYSASALLACLLAGAAALLSAAPVDSPQKRIDALERRVYRGRMVAVLGAACAAAVAFFAVGAVELSVAVTCGVLLSAAMAVCGSVKNRVLKARRHVG